MTSGSPYRLIISFTLPMLLATSSSSCTTWWTASWSATSSATRHWRRSEPASRLSTCSARCLWASGTGATVMISQYYGARDLEKVDHTINTIYMALLVGVVPLTLIGVFLSEPLLRLMAGAGRRHAGDGKDLHDYYLHRRHRQPGL